MQLPRRFEFDNNSNKIDDLIAAKWKLTASNHYGELKKKLFGGCVLSSSWNCRNRRLIQLHRNFQSFSQTGLLPLTKGIVLQRIT
ncbi:hypothetical protein OUZ56_031462 [Daphnia magna]|uniref:Uncharacterized protein n=1 Tax=Daphnia magna TaxID=35525 RepID=A0ABQ9ZUA6_9CRUS|nr:hypothetical protein OUZ56_031462 [Daphnia magna]